MLIHAVNLRITVHRIQIQTVGVTFREMLDLTLYNPTITVSSFHRPYHALIIGWQELMKNFLL